MTRNLRILLAGLILAALILICPSIGHCTAPTCQQLAQVTLAGNLRGANGIPSSNYIITLVPSQQGLIAGCGVNLATANTCSTSTDGSVVGIQNPLTATINTTSGSGSLGSGVYYTVYAWYYQPASTVLYTLPSPETVQTLSTTGSLVVNPPSSGVPAGALGMAVYISTVSGAEKLQGFTTGSASFVQSAALSSGANVPASNTTVCAVTANDAVWPTGTGYKVTMTDQYGNPVPNYPMQWQLMGAGSTINLSNGLPYYHGVVYYPAPILSAPANHGTQSISGPLSLSGYDLLNVGNLNFSPTGELTFGSSISIGVDSFSALQTAVTACGTLPCSIFVSTTIAIPSNLTIPSNVTLYVNGGQLQVASAVTLVISGPIVAPAVPIFSGPGGVSGLSSVKPEWFGVLAPAGPVTVCVAIGALGINGGDVYLGPVAYRSGCEKIDPTDYNVINWMTKPNVHIKGAANPQFNGSNTQLINGSVIWGGFYVGQGASGFSTDNVGYDVGSVVKSAYFSSFTALDSLVITSALPYDNTFYSRLVNIAVTNGKCLGYSMTSADHCTLVENVEGGHIDHWQSVMHEYGVVLKGITSTVNDIYARGHLVNPVLVKSNSYAPSFNDTLSNIKATELTTLGDTGPFGIQAESSALDNVTVSNLSTHGLIGGVNLLSTGEVVFNVSMSAVSVDAGAASQESVGNQYCLGLGSFVSAVTLTGMNCTNYNLGIWLTNFTNKNINVSNVTFTNIGGNVIFNDGGTLSISNSTFDLIGGTTATIGVLTNGGVAVTTVHGLTFNTAPTTAYSTAAGGVNIVDPIVGAPTAGQAACIKAAGPPVQIGYCSTTPTGGSCTCN